MLCLCCLLLLSLSLTAQDPPSYEWFVGGTLQGRQISQQSQGERLVPRLDPFGRPLLDAFGNPQLRVEIIDETISRTDFTFAPRVGKQLSERWLGGFLLRMSITGTRRQGGTFPERGSRVIGTGGGLFARYLLNPRQRLQVFAEPAMTYVISTAKRLENGDWEEDGSSNTLDAVIRLGGQYAIGPRFRLLTQIDALSFSHRDGGFGQTDTNITTFSFDLLPSRVLDQLAVGVEYRF